MSVRHWPPGGKSVSADQLTGHQRPGRGRNPDNAPTGLALAQRPKAPGLCGKRILQPSAQESDELLNESRSGAPICKPAKWNGSRRQCLCREGASACVGQLPTLDPGKLVRLAQRGDPGAAFLHRRRRRAGGRTGTRAVWLNPPYAGRADRCVRRQAARPDRARQPSPLRQDHVDQMAYTETSWFHNLTAVSNAVCFTRGRIKFVSPHGEKCAPTNGQSFFYFGADRERFMAERGLARSWCGHDRNTGSLNS